MKKFIVLFIFLGIIACQSKQQKETPTIKPPPIVKTKEGVYNAAIVYAAATDFEFLVDDKPMLFRVNYGDSTYLPDLPINLTIKGEEGPPYANPILVGKKYQLNFGSNEQLQSIQLLAPHDPTSIDIPAIPEQYSGIIPIGEYTGSRAYLNLFTDLTAILLVNYKSEGAPLYQVGRWTRTEGGQKVSIQFPENPLEFLVKDKALSLVSNQMGIKKLDLIATEKYNLCHYLQEWLSDLSTIDGETRVPVEAISPTTPLDKILRTEHAYMNLHGELATVFKTKEEQISKTLKENSIVSDICELLLPTSGH